MSEGGLRPVLHPVLWEVAVADRRLAPRARNEALSRLARRALRASAVRGGFRLGRLEQDPSGRPRASNGCHWSLTHKPAYVGGVCAAAPVGIDVERFRTVAPGLYTRLADPWEWERAGGQRPEAFFRLWTAKEAAVKATGAGIADLRRCRLLRILDETHLQLEYRGRSWTAAQWTFRGHVAAVAPALGEVRWTLREEPGGADLAGAGDALSAGLRDPDGRPQDDDR